ncbi:hypothetical protein FW774_17360 [Pedobacter sp. BS3]|uniref:hypothetical protein n=1 Tax=Pedobacter sp. BS3 TaxID=2567937 RepID=UPI0011EE6C75|nr:hypothetical protein [Pedobacter sp. BS3]TZF81824.1 hypothetical protein FW774_17360 [Pedobacter sp. BS3]
MARTNTKIVSKYYDNMQQDSWNLGFEYESENGNPPSAIKAQGAKQQQTVFINKANNQVQVIFSNGEYDADLVAAVAAEFTAIAAQFAPEPVEGE